MPSTPRSTEVLLHEGGVMIGRIMEQYGMLSTEYFSRKNRKRSSRYGTKSKLKDYVFARRATPTALR